MVTEPAPGTEDEPGDTPVGAGVVTTGMEEEPGDTPVGAGLDTAGMEEEPGDTPVGAGRVSVSPGTFPVGVPV